MTEISALITKFVDEGGLNVADVYNEFSLQHELGLFLRRELPDYKVQFERNVNHFLPSKRHFTKRELDIAVFSPDRKELKYAIELKFPRSGQHPEQMFSFCKDIAFAEELKAMGFAQAAVLIVVDHHLFHTGPGEGIYGFFRAGRVINGEITKPTGKKDEQVTIRGSYTAAWTVVSPSMRYLLVEATNGP